MSRFWKRWLMTVAMVITLSGCVDFLDEGDSRCSDDPTMTQELARYTLPSGYSNLEVRCSRWMDHTTTEVRFDMPPDALPEFQESTLIETWVTNSAQVERFDLVDQRQFNAMTSTLYGETSAVLLGSGTQQVLIDLSNPQRYTVYLTYFISY